MAPHIVNISVRSLGLKVKFGVDGRKPPYRIIMIQRYLLFTQIIKSHGPSAVVGVGTAQSKYVLCSD